jgi:hypothetical protein
MIVNVVPTNIENLLVWWANHAMQFFHVSFLVLKDLAFWDHKLKYNEI